MTCGLCSFWGIHQAEIDNPHARFFKSLRYRLNISRQTFLESFKLRPIGIESDSKETHGELMMRRFVAHVSIHSADSRSLAKGEPPERDSIVKNICRLKKEYSLRIFRPREHIAPCRLTRGFSHGGFHETFEFDSLVSRSSVYVGDFARVERAGFSCPAYRSLGSGDKGIQDHAYLAGGCKPATSPRNSRS